MRGLGYEGDWVWYTEKYMSIIPAINAATFEDADKQLRKILTFLPDGELIHLDIVDGKFAPNITWGTPQEMGAIIPTPERLGNRRFELHLMVENPEGVLDAWLRTGLVRRVIIHLEAMTDSVYILAKCKKYRVEAMLAANPGTDAERLLAHTSDFSYMQILAVYPGLAGQKFQQKIIDKIKFLKQHAPSVTIEVDGGVNLEIAKQCKDAGASLFVSASYILANDNPKEAFETLIKATS